MIFPRRDLSPEENGGKQISLEVDCIYAASRVPRITFGIIVLNGEPFIRSNLRSLYPFAHEIIVVEGASQNAAAVATAEGHSIDGTLGMLRRFKVEEDVADKLRIITAEDHGYSDGFWPGEKDEQSNAYALQASGDFLWQVDIDEFYQAEDMCRVLSMLSARPEISGVSFHWKNFWGDFGYLVDGWDYRDLVKNMGGIRRVFRWRAGYRYVSHRPPTVLDDRNRDLFELNWVSSDDTARMGIFCYHYGMVLPAQARQKTTYYKNLLPACVYMPEWYQETFLELRHPFNILHGTNPPSWLTRFNGTHPAEINSLRNESRWNIPGERRPTDDIESLLATWSYRAGTVLLHYMYFFVPPLLRVAWKAWVTVRDLFVPQATIKLLRRTKTAMHRWMTTN